MTRPLLVLVVAALTACGGPPKVRETEEKEPAWAAEYAAAVARACDCKDDPCIRVGKMKLEEMIAAHGGIEEAPPSIHENLTRFEACFLTTSHDLARDLAAQADVICGCATTACVGDWWQQMWSLADKYGAGHPDMLRDTHGSDPTSTAAFDRLAACNTAVQVSSEDYLAILTTANDELCACTLPECGKAAIAKSDAILGKYLVVVQDSSLDSQIAAAEAKRCKCAKKFPPTTEIDTEFPINGVPIRVTGTITWSQSCKDRAL
jgi:hypothetical protein